MLKIEITRRKNAKISAGNVIMRILLLACAVLAYGKSGLTEVILVVQEDVEYFAFSIVEISSDF